MSERSDWAGVVIGGSRNPEPGTRTKRPGWPTSLAALSAYCAKSKVGAKPNWPRRPE